MNHHFSVSGWKTRLHHGWLEADLRARKRVETRRRINRLKEVRSGRRPVVFLATA